MEDQEENPPGYSPTHSHSNSNNTYLDESPSSPKDSIDEPVRTLFVSGLPADVKPREMYNLFRPFPGFISASLNFTGEKKMPVSFVLFSDQISALAARDALQGITFDPDTSVILRIELAKANSKAKRRRGTIGNLVGGHEDKRIKANYLIDPYSYPIQGQVPGIYNDIIGNIYPSYPFIGHDPNAIPFMQLKNMNNINTGSNRSGSPPCSTLFVGNLSTSTNEKELEDHFRACPGFEKFKMTKKDDVVMCFVEYSNIQYSTRAMNSLQGIILRSSDRGIRIEYARNRMNDAIKNSK